MQWNCPHCGILLAVSDSAIGAGWAFSKCYKCGGYALIRKAEVNVIKVDKAPPGERVILPEASADPEQSLLNKAASERMGKIMDHRRPAQVGFYPRKESSSLVHSDPVDISQSYLPEALPEIPNKAKRSYLMPIGISTTALVTLISGFYLVQQGQNLSVQTPSQSLGQGAPLSHLPAKAERAKLDKAELVDRVQKSAMAPVRGGSFLESEGSVLNEATRLGTAKDDVAGNLPEKATPQGAQQFAPIFVKMRNMKINVYAGPGTDFAVIGTPLADFQYHVTEWNNRWFKVTGRMRRIGDTLGGLDEISGWVQNESVQVISN